jgi:hypothetical protein
MATPATKETPALKDNSEARTVIRDDVPVRTFMREETFHAANAAWLAVNMKDDESATHWYARACRSGITFA